ncbi:A1pp-domain-containing protein [Neolentinus lepideus HHB14362 ss-1]|uniref:A1pp-domain-containing protein n=1 Tax=Neolentinus lepideus HHB14362 ss-1 TaxID=1314782 RepID=A0A165MB49_9AGAM|nr:A1pp-domain-containing protein [Neolentinus lepideus HHB14362 ss-1]
MAVRLSQIRTIHDLYKATALQPASADKLRYQAKTSLLDRVSLYQGDITKFEVDVIVNAANKSLLGGGGVDGAIHAAAGRELLKECRTLNGCETGDAKITKGYKLPSLHVIHTVGPIYSKSDVERKAEQLASCYRTSLQLAVDNSLKHIAFPSISTGIYGYPITDATHLALYEVRKFLDSEDGEKLKVIFVVWSDADKAVYEELIPEYFPPDDQPSEAQQE